MSAQRATKSPTPLGNRRVTGKEQYYTPDDLALRLTREVISVVGSLEGRTVLEPAGGTGAFIRAAQALGAASVVSFDIEPKHTDVVRADFLSQKVRLTDAVAISNPPFGRNNSLSIPFFNKAADHAEFICFIVPRSWRKWSVINRLDRRFELVADHDIAMDYVDDQGTHLSKQLLLKTCFQIWRRLPDGKQRPLYKVRDMGLITKVKPEDADIAMRVFGFNCGRVFEQFERKPNSTLMFLKLNDPRVLQVLQTADFERFFKNTAYTEALGIQEINYLVNEAVLGDPMLQEES
ncbi:MAG: hypothetical protein KGL77_04485 [Actinomycetales bacterium]|nr:hypothetical protein [Actinomycetales bacterium]